ncbi:MAG: RNase adapter RapZ [Rhodospirillaceae bacterium]|jgi:RNase adapter protein RapZ|nr:RNase adapter RapZ [Rhodospirillaceae bacterium]MBT4588140.1 RNase adapter RapZ [Rhodospirillaceae bacterium]MBT4938584.1 RNase adapter RapZ [Rhodospirillaceae bacterium]MBT7266786.1 RNase adapter RapZ [Rhodospirillaceae bacterium]
MSSDEIPNSNPDNIPDNIQAVIVTGMSGAGKSSALKALEDMNFEAIDNVPLTLLEAILTGGPQQFEAPGFDRPVALGVDIRTRDFAVDDFLNHFDEITAANNINAQILFVDCDDEVLHRRYEETRHRHPLAMDRPVTDGIQRERKLVTPLRERADMVVDTTAIGPGELKTILQAQFGSDAKQELTVFVTSFSYRKGLPREADLVLDVRFLRNPHYEGALREMSGKDEAVGTYIKADEAFDGFFANLTQMLTPLMPRFEAEGKSYLTIAFGCTGGRHRSVYVAEQLAKWFDKEGLRAQINHRDMS